MDLSKFDTTSAAADGAKLELLSPVDETILRDDAGNPITITLLGLDAEVIKKAQRIQTNMRLKRSNRSKVTAEEIEENTLKTLVLCTIGWSGVSVDGVTLEFSKENAHRVYTRFGWIRDQVDAFVSERANFIKT